MSPLGFEPKTPKEPVFETGAIPDYAMVTIKDIKKNI